MNPRRRNWFAQHVSPARRWCRACATPLLATALVAAPNVAPTLSPELGEPPTTGFHLEVLPTPFQRNPVLDMTVITEFTPFGRTLSPATPERPVYYVLHDAGFTPRGWTIAGEKPPAPEVIATALQAALAKASFLPADPAHPPSLLLIYYWGSHNVMDRDVAAMFPHEHWAGVIERSSLVGGATFRRTMQEMANSSDPGLTRLFNFVGREKTLEFLDYQAQHDLHYAVVSAYLVDDVAHAQRRLAWRTTMTVCGVGTSMSETLRPLVYTAGPYFGREIPVVAIKRRIKRGTVELGPLKVVDEDVVAHFAPTTDSR